MQLFTTYGVQSSVPPKTVVAVINEGSAASIQNYDITFLDNQNIVPPSGLIQLSNTGHARTDKINVFGQSQIIVNSNLVYSFIFFWNNNSYLGYYGNESSSAKLGNFPTSTTITLPANTTHIAFATYKAGASGNWQNSPVSFSTFSTLTVSFESSTTFTAVNYDVTWTLGDVYNNVGVLETGANDYYSSQKIEIINNSLTLDNDVYTMHFYNNSTYLGHYQILNATSGYWATNNLGAYSRNPVIPANATHFALTIHTAGLVPGWSLDMNVSYVDTSSGKTVTFFDEYPNGTQIGDVVNVQASTYNLTYNNGSFYSNTGQLLTGNTAWHYTNKLPIQNNTLIINNNTWTYLHFWNNSTYLGHIQNSNVTANNSYFDTNLLGIGFSQIPNNATHFAFIARTESTTWSPIYSLAEFQQLSVSYSTGQSTEYNLTFRESLFYLNNGTDAAPDSRYSSTTKLAIVNNSVVVNSPNWFTIHFWNGSTYLGHYSNTHFTLTSDGYWSTNLLGQYNNVVPANATDFAFTNNISVLDRPNQVPYNTFQTITVSYEATGTITVDPPATYKIRQLVFE